MNQQCLIEDGESLSAPIALARHTVVGIHVPASWTTADLSFQASFATKDGDADDYFDVFDAEGVELVVAADAERHVVLSPGALAGVEWLKIRSGPTASPVAQTGDQTLELVTYPVT